MTPHLSLDIHKWLSPSTFTPSVSSVILGDPISAPNLYSTKIFSEEDRIIWERDLEIERQWQQEQE